MEGQKVQNKNSSKITPVHNKMNTIKTDKNKKMSINYINTQSKKTIKSKMNKKTTKPKMNLIKPSTSKLVTIICLALLANEIIPDGWKYTDNFTKKKKIKKKIIKYKIKIKH